MNSLCFEQSLADACVLLLVGSRTVFVVIVVFVEGIFAVGRKATCDQFCRDLNLQIDNLGELRWYAGGRYVEIGMLAP